MYITAVIGSGDLNKLPLVRLAARRWTTNLYSANWLLGNCLIDRKRGWLTDFSSALGHQQQTRKVLPWNSWFCLDAFDHFHYGYGLLVFSIHSRTKRILLCGFLKREVLSFLKKSVFVYFWEILTARRDEVCDFSSTFLEAMSKYRLRNPSYTIGQNETHTVLFHRR